MTRTTPPATPGPPSAPAQRFSSPRTRRWASRARTRATCWIGAQASVRARARGLTPVWPREVRPLAQLLLLVVLRDVQVAQVVERPAGGPEPGVDLVELRGVEGRPEAGQPLAVGEAQLGGEVLALEQADVVDPPGERLGGLDLDR